MKNIFISIFICIIFTLPACSAHQQAEQKKDASQPSAQKDTVAAALPIIDIKPSTLKAKRSEGRFITREVKILNRGGSTLYIKHVSPSCKCSNATVMDGSVEPMTIGTIRLSVNTDGVVDGNNIVEFIVESNAKNSPNIIRIEITE